jgi:hypothetical protein
MKGKGKLIYISVEAYKGLEKFGTKCISPDFTKRNSRGISYNGAILLLLKFAGMGEQIYKEQMKHLDEK